MKLKLKDGSHVLTANDFPSFLWPLNHVYNPEAPDDKFCESEIMIRVCACSLSISLTSFSNPETIPHQALNATLTGPSTLKGGKRTANTPSMSFKHKFTRITPHTVAYHAVLVRTFLGAHAHMVILIIRLHVPY